MPKMIMNYCEQLDRVPTMTNTREDNNVTDRTNVVYTEKEIKLPWLIRVGVVCDKNQIKQRCD